MNQWHESQDSSNTIELTDEELRSRIIKLNDNQLSNIKNMSYYYLISKTGKLVKLVEGENVLDEMKLTEEKKIIIESYYLIINSFKKFHTSMMEKEIEQEIDILSNIREKLYDLTMALYAYEIENSYIKELIDHHIMRKMSKIEYKDLNVDRTEVSNLVARIKQILDNEREYNVFIAVVSNILSVLPFRISKLKYFDIVKSTLIRNFTNYPINIIKAQIEEYKILFDSRLVGNYGILFDNYFTEIQKFCHMDILSKTTEELEDISKDIIQLTKEISKWSLFINHLGIIINRLIVIYMTKKESALPDEVKDVFENWEEYYRKREGSLLESLKNTCEKELEKLERELLKGAKNLESLNQKAISRQEFTDKSFNDKVLFTTKVLTYYNDLKFTRSDILFPDKYEIVGRDYLIQLVDNLIQYMNRSISTMNNLEGKIRMRRFLSLLQLPFENMEEFFSYIQYSLDGRALSAEEVLFSIDAVNFLLNEYLERQ